MKNLTRDIEWLVEVGTTEENYFCWEEVRLNVRDGVQLRSVRENIEAGAFSMQDVWFRLRHVEF